MLRGHLSEKVDIYSFGILILEIISRRRCNYNDLSSEDYLLEQVIVYIRICSTLKFVFITSVVLSYILKS